MLSSGELLYMVMIVFLMKKFIRGYFAIVWDARWYPTTFLTSFPVSSNNQKNQLYCRSTGKLLFCILQGILAINSLYPYCSINKKKCEGCTDVCDSVRPFVHPIPKNGRRKKHQYAVNSRWHRHDSVLQHAKSNIYSNGSVVYTDLHTDTY
jgi:hypothetical protein